MYSVGIRISVSPVDTSEAADDGARERRVRLAADQPAERHRQEAEHGGQAGHQDRTEPGPAGPHDRLA